MLEAPELAPHFELEPNDEESDDESLEEDEDAPHFELEADSESLEEADDDSLEDAELAPHFEDVSSVSVVDAPQLDADSVSSALVSVLIGC
ncbi:hypothetical protein [Halostagnicola bangensis]